MRRIGIIFSLLVLALGAQAQTDTVARKAHALREVEVSAKEAETIRSTIPVQLITDSMMTRLGIMTISDALTHIAGITVRDYGGAGGMKTVSARGIGSRHTGVSYDGIALADCQTGEIDLSRYSLDNVKELRMVIGDDDNLLQPARNVSSAAYLVIDNLGVPSEEEKMQLKASLTAGSWGTIAPSLHYGQRLSDRLALSLSGEFIHSDNDYPYKIYNVRTVSRDHRKNSRMNAGHIESGLMWHIASSQTLSAKAYYYDNNRQLPGIAHLYTNESRETLHEQNAFMQAVYSGMMTSRWALKGFLKYNWAKSGYENGTAGSGIPDARYYQQEYYAAVATVYSPTDWLALNYSGDYFYNTLTSTPLFYGHPSRHSWLQTVAAKASLRRLTFISRLLWSNYYNKVKDGSHAEDGHRWSPSVSLSYRLLAAEELYVRAFWKSIFRMPTFNETYYYHLGSTSLRPERTSQVNLGFTYSKQAGRFAMQLTADAYTNRVSQKIIAIPFNMFVWRMMNLAKVRVYGLDITSSLHYSITSRHAIDLNGNYSLQRAENRSNPSSAYYKNQIAYTPRHTFTATITWSNPWANLSLTADGLSERWTTNGHEAGTRLAGFAELHLGLWRTFIISGHKLTARAQINNITGRQYELVANYPMPRTSWRLSLIMQL